MGQQFKGIQVSGTGKISMPPNIAYISGTAAVGPTLWHFQPKLPLASAILLALAVKFGYHEFARKLRLGQNVQFRPRGNSMKPKIESGQLITVEPVKLEDVSEGDIVFCKVAGNFYVHLVSAVQGQRLQISNNHGHVNGWIGANALYGKVTKVGE